MVSFSEKGCQTLITLKNLSLSYEKKNVLSDINACWQESQMIMLVGENGTGKSTLLKALLGLHSYQGSACISGKEIKTLKPAERANYFAYVPQQKLPPMHEKTEEFLLMGTAYKLSLFEQPSAEALKKADEVFSLFQLEHLRGRYMDELSGGEVQMLYVARCFVEEHKMLILDEPCTYLDFHRQYAFLNLLKEMLAKKNTGALISIHDPNAALVFADKIVCLREHKIFAEKEIHTLADKKEAAEYLNQLYQNEFYTEERNNQILMQWKGVPYASNE